MSKLTAWMTVMALMALAFPVMAGSIHNIKVGGEQYEPSEIKAWSGDTIRFCNHGKYRRQPYSANRYNRFGNRVAETYKMIKNGECTETKVQNPTPRWLKVVVHDAVNPKAKLVIEISPKS
ncbi:MAG: hypothetical protein R3257_02515 [bacterium]|nr:hypothetical protein [bacterium]